jgi:hypothetical protein
MSIKRRNSTERDQYNISYLSDPPKLPPFGCVLRVLLLRASTLIRSLSMMARVLPSGALIYYIFDRTSRKGLIHTGLHTKIEMTCAYVISGFMGEEVRF